MILNACEVYKYSRILERNSVDHFFITYQGADRNILYVFCRLLNKIEHNTVHDKKIKEQPLDVSSETLMTMVAMVTL